MADYLKGSVYYHNSYYYIGHFSRFVRPEARRVVSTSSIDDLDTIAFINADGSLTVVVMNRTEQDYYFGLKFNGQIAPTDCPAHSISTYCFSAV